MEELIPMSLSEEEVIELLCRNTISSEEIEEECETEVDEEFDDYEIYDVEYEWRQYWRNR
jgi:hypothetical protein